MPEILVVHLKRFRFNRPIGQSPKILGHVQFGASLDMVPCLSSQGAPIDSHSSLRDLYAVVVHRGDTVGCCCTQFTCFTSTKVQMLTQMKRGLGGMLLHSIFFCFTSTKVQMLTQMKRGLG